MSVMSGSVSVAANAVSLNQFTGLLFENLSRNSRVALAISAAVTGLNATFTIGGTTVVNDSLVSYSNRFPILPDDLFAMIGGRRGAKLFLTFRNTTGAAIVVNWMIQIG